MGKHRRRRIQFSLKACFALTIFVALLSRFVIQPEIRRQHAFKTLRENTVIGPPLVTLFGGRAPGVYENVPASHWFIVRQRIARLFGIHPEPWCENCVLIFDRNDKSLVALVNSCEDLSRYLDRK